ncbi:MAG TPA: hypothetical protein PLI95_28065, partial [Polyangiaceae bacterium]|nr:hypothetical protein [Polyangiaceae bacterium]
HFNSSASGLHVDRVYAGQRALALPPLVDAEDYAFATVTAKDKMPVVVRVNKLIGGLSSQWGSLGACL